MRGAKTPYPSLNVSTYPGIKYLKCQIIRHLPICLVLLIQLDCLPD